MKERILHLSEKIINKTFGYKSIWMAVKGNSIEMILKALNLENVEKQNWDYGLELSNKTDGTITVTEAFEGWHFVVGLSLPELSSKSNTINWLSNLSLQLGEIYYFCSYHTVDYYGFAIAKTGKVKRAYSYFGDKGKVELNIGDITREERDLGFNFAEKDETLWEEGSDVLDEDKVLQLASVWTINPEKLLGYPLSDVSCGKILIDKS